MQNPRLATRYAKSLLDLSIEKNQLEKVYEDMLYLQAVCKSSKDFVSLLRSPVLPPDKKLAVFDGLTKDRTSELTSAFSKLLIKKGREANLPEIITAFVDQYKKLKKIYTVKLTTATPVSEEVKNEIVSKVQEQTEMKNIELKAEVNEDLIGGFVLQLGDTLVDASVAYDLNVIKKQFLNNDFVYKIR